MDFTVGDTVVSIDPDERHVVTTLPDGSTVEAAPSAEQESVDFVRSLGYQGSDEDVAWLFAQDHDLAHALVAHSEGLPWSPLLYEQAHDIDVVEESNNDRKREVARALALIIAANLGLRRAAEYLTD